MNNFGLFMLLVTTIVVTVESRHMFFGTNVLRQLMHHNSTAFRPQTLSMEKGYYYKLPATPPNEIPRTIQGVMAYDMTNTKASANVTLGGLGYDYVKIRMKSEAGKALHYDIYIYV